MNRDKLQDDLTSLNVMALYDFMCPFDYSTPITAEHIKNRQAIAHKRYLTDPIFCQRIKMIVARTLDIIVNAKNKPLKQQREDIRCTKCGTILDDEKCWDCIGDGGSRTD